MKALALTFLLLPFACMAQPSKAPAAKPSTTDCPDFKNKPQVSKAAYFESLRHTKSATVQPLPASTERKTTLAKPKTESKKPAVPSFSSSDNVIEKKPVTASKETKERMLRLSPGR